MKVVCEYCKLLFSSKSVLERHQKTTLYCLEFQKRNNIAIKRVEYSCSCGETFTVKSSMTRHQKRCVSFRNVESSYIQTANINNDNIAVQNPITPSFDEPITRPKDTALYIITNPAYEKIGQYKVGIHAGTIESLINRYRTPIPELNIKLFIEMADGKAKEIENLIKRDFSAHRVVGSGGNPSEFYTIELVKLYTLISRHLSEVSPKNICSGDEKLQTMVSEMDMIKDKIKVQLEEMIKWVPNTRDKSILTAILEQAEMF